MGRARRQEFLAGRWVLRRALRAVGCCAAAIRYEGRRPRVPDGAVAPLSHSRGWRSPSPGSGPPSVRWESIWSRVNYLSKPPIWCCRPRN
ncbi:hypothetical protein AB0H86_26400 [Streptomyces sp. NPDC050997]|uniref:hypothetical protein n=1 Tax=Streptomyces sp. NPDC050997 TaxID=3155519 RepID=UPI0034404512